MRRRAVLASLAAASVLGSRSTLAVALAAKRRLGVFYAGWSEFASGANERQEGIEERAAILKAFDELGYKEGRNLVVDWRYFDMDFSRAPQMAAELVRAQVDALVTAGFPQTRALQAATKTIPIVTEVDDPVASGFTEDLVRPRGNITGFVQTHPDSSAKQIELIRRVMPKLDRLVLIGDIRYPGAPHLMHPVEVAATAAGIGIEVRMTDRSGIDRVLGSIKGFGARAAFIETPGFDMTEVARLAIRHGVAAMYDESVFAEMGGLMTFKMYHENRIQRIAAMVAKVFRGIQPAEIPWELPDRSHIAINLSTAKALGLTIPSDVLLRADQIVE
jgi:putative tryptophan/tyrosine transport system substrate-binding protein